MNILYITGVYSKIVVAFFRMSPGYRPWPITALRVAPAHLPVMGVSVVMGVPRKHWMV